MDIQSPSLVNGIAHSPEAGGARALSDEAGFNRVFREELRQAPAPREIDPRADVKNARAQFHGSGEPAARRSRTDAAEPAADTGNTGRATAMAIARAARVPSHRMLAFGQRATQSGHHADTTGRRRIRVTAVYSDASVRGAPVGAERSGPRSGFTDQTGSTSMARSATSRTASKRSCRRSRCGFRTHVRNPIRKFDPTQFRSARPGPPKR